MATTSSSTISGIASNIQWQDLVDQLMTQEQTRLLDPLTAKITTDKTSISTWGSFQSLVANFQSTATTLSSTAFDAMQSYVGSGSTGKTLLTMTATGDATPGTYKTEVLATAKADKIGGSWFTNTTSALGLSGDFYVNGVRVTVSASDTLATVRDAINAANAGATPSGVAASILSATSGSNRLVLTSSQVGASGLQLVDGASGVLASLGLTDGTMSSNVTASGGAQSFRFTDATTAIGTLLGGTMPAAANIKVGNTTVSVNLATQSLNDISAAIAAAGVSSSVDSSNRINAGAVVSAVPGDADSARIAALLGFTTAGRGAVAQVLTDSSAFTDASSNPATTTTLLSDLKVAGLPAGLAAGDSIVINGQRGDGTAISSTITLDGSETLQTLLTKLNDSTMFGGGSRTATASLTAGGVLKMTDAIGGDSQLALSLVVNKAGGGTASLGQLTTATTGFSRQIVQGTDAQIRVDGTLITRSSNTISDAVAGVTFNLVSAEPGTVLDVPVARDTTGVVNSINQLVSTYNSVASFVSSQTGSGGALPFNSTMRSTLAALKASLVQAVPGISGAYTQAALVGLTFDKTGQLQLDATAFKAALASNPTAVKALFTKTVTPSTGITFLSSNTKTGSGTFAVNITSAATVPTFTGSGFTGSYTDSGTPDAVTITDGDTFLSGSVSLATGDDIDAIVSKFNTLFTSKGMKLTASKSGGQLVITGSSYGTAAKFNVAFSGTNPTTQLGLASAQVTGTDIVGTIGGAAATGSGQRLTATAGPAEGLSIKYTGAGSFSGQVVHTLGAAALLTNIADAITRSGDGLAESQKSSLQTEIDTLTSQSSTVQERLDRHRAALVAQFTKMETALSMLNAQGTALTSQLKSLQSSGG